MLRQAFRAMGCQMQALLDSNTPAAAAALEALPGWFAGWEQCLSRFRPESELMRLNRSVGRPMAVSAVLWEVLDVAVRAHEQSAGLVTPTLLVELEAAGYDRPFADLLAPPVPAGPSLGPALPPRADLSGLALDDPIGSIVRDEAARTVQLLDGLQLDLGGVAKGWAAEQAARRLAVHGPALVEAGGDIAVSGPRRNGAPWPIGVADPHLPESDLAVLALERGGVAARRRLAPSHPGPAHRPAGRHRGAERDGGGPQRDGGRGGRQGRPDPRRGGRPRLDRSCAGLRRHAGPGRWPPPAQPWPGGLPGPLRPPRISHPILLRR